MSAAERQGRAHSAASQAADAWERGDVAEWRWLMAAREVILRGDAD